MKHVTGADGDAEVAEEEDKKQIFHRHEKNELQFVLHHVSWPNI
jgi:hypothetical protein